MQLSFIVAIIASLIYVVVSLLNPKKEYNLDKLLHRGEFAVTDDVVVGDSANKAKSKWEVFWHKLGLSDEFSKWDRVIFFSVIGFTVFWTLNFWGIAIYHIIFGTGTIFWIRYWWCYVVFSIIATVILSVWVYAGGLIDVRKMLYRLRTLKRDDHDDGWVNNQSDREDAEPTSGILEQKS